MRTWITTKTQQNVNNLCFPDEITVTKNPKTKPNQNQNHQTKHPEHNKGKSGSQQIFLTAG